MEDSETDKKALSESEDSLEEAAAVADDDSKTSPKKSKKHGKHRRHSSHHSDKSSSKREKEKSKSTRYGSSYFRSSQSCMHAQSSRNIMKSSTIESNLVKQVCKETAITYSL